MEFRDLKKQYQTLKGDIDQAMANVATSGAFIMGSPVKELEQELASYVGVKHCLACANGTDALTLALKALGIGKGDAVFVPDFTFFATAEVVALEGATPVFVDVDPRTFNIDPKSLDDAVRSVHDLMTLRPKAVIAVDLFGQPANYPELRAITKREGMYLIEDGAQGFGGSIRLPKPSGEGFIVKRACSFGDISTTSFFPAKPLGCYGDGGAVFTDNDEWAALMDSYHIHGKGSDRYDNVRIGMNSRMDSIQAAILLVKLKAFKDYELVDVNKMAMRYTEKLKNVAKTPIVPEGFYSSWAQYTLQVENKEVREGLQAALKALDIPTAIYYPIPMHRQTAFSYLDLDDNRCPVSDQLADTVISLPIHPYLSERDQDSICDAVREFLRK